MTELGGMQSPNNRPSTNNYFSRRSFPCWHHQKEQFKTYQTLLFKNWHSWIWKNLVVNRKFEKKTKKTEWESCASNIKQKFRTGHTHPPSLCWVSKRPKRVRPLDTPKRSTLMAGWKIGHFGPPMHSPSIQDVLGIVPLEAKWFPPNPIEFRMWTHKGVSQTIRDTIRDVMRPKSDTKTHVSTSWGWLSIPSFSGFDTYQCRIWIPLNSHQNFWTYMCFIWRPINLLTWFFSLYGRKL